MKKLILAAITTACAASVFAQGTVTFNNRIAGVGTTHVYYGGAPRTGNGPGDVPAGATDYTGYTLIGTTGSLLAANTTFAQLIGAPGLNTAEASLVPSSSPATTFRTGAAAGNIVGATATFNNIAPDAANGTFELVVWDNKSGLYPTWTQASVAWAQGLIAAGRSAPFNLLAIGGSVNTPPSIISSNPGEGLQSFAIVVPEPASVALAGLGAAALMIFRRRK